MLNTGKSLLTEHLKSSSLPPFNFQEFRDIHEEMARVLDKNMQRFIIASQLKEGENPEYTTSVLTYQTLCLRIKRVLLGILQFRWDTLMDWTWQWGPQLTPTFRALLDSSENDLCSRYTQLLQEYSQETLGEYPDMDVTLNELPPRTSYSQVRVLHEGLLLPSSGEPLGKPNDLVLIPHDDAAALIRLHQVEGFP